MRRLLLGLLAVFCLAVVSLLVMLTGYLVTAGNGDSTAAAVFWSLTVGFLALAAICLSLLVITLGVYVVVQADEEAGSSS